MSIEWHDFACDKPLDWARSFHPGSVEIYQSKALELMAKFFFAPAHSDGGTGLRQHQVSRQRVERAIEILSQRLRQPPDLEELGRTVGCSPHYLSHTFSREMGLTIPQYLRQMRMERAAELLKSGKCNVTEAALEVGYNSLSHFSQAFCETMRCCPGLYPLGMTRSAGLKPPADLRGSASLTPRPARLRLGPLRQ